MLRKTRGIVLRRTKYSESSLIVKICTAEFGLQSFIAQGVRSKRGKIKANLFEPLTLLDLVVYYKEKSTLHRIREVRPSPPFHSIPFDLVKSSVALFLAEVLYRSLKEGEPDQQLYHYAENSVQLLDLEEKVSPLFHLHFLLGLARILGFCPDTPPDTAHSHFDLNEGEFLHHEPEHNYFLAEDLTPYFAQLLGTEFDGLSNLNFPKKERKLLLDKLLLFYQIHTENLRGIQSHKVLEDIFY